MVSCFLVHLRNYVVLLNPDNVKQPLLQSLTHLIALESFIVLLEKDLCFCHFIVLWLLILLSVSNLGKARPAGTRRLCHVRLTLDMTSYRRCILVEKWKSGWCQYLTSIWHWLNVGFWLHNRKTTGSQCQLTSVLDIKLTLTWDV